MIRPIRAEDVPRLRELGLEHEFSRDFMCGLVAVDEFDSPVLFIGAWKRAEVHMALDPTWGTPGSRMALFRAVHEEMERMVVAEGVGQVVTWLDGMKAFARRLKGLGWVRSELTSWHRKVG